MPLKLGEEKSDFQTSHRRQAEVNDALGESRLIWFLVFLFLLHFDHSIGFVLSVEHANADAEHADEELWTSGEKTGLVERN